MVVTGASSGIGRDCALKLAEAGAIVILAARTPGKLEETIADIRQFGGEGHAYACDIADLADCDRFIDTVLENHGQVDILINNAGRSIRRSVQYSFDRFHDYERTMQLNYFGALRLIMGFAPRMLERIEELFGRLPARSDPPRLVRPEPPQRGERRVNLEGPGNTSYLQVAYHAPAAGDPDFMPMTVLTTILTGAAGMNLFSSSPPNRSSRLYRALVETGVAVSLSGSMPAMLDPYLYQITATARTGNSPAQVEEAMDPEIERVLEQPISEAELETAIKQTKAQFAYSSESVTNQGYWLGYSAIVADTDWFESFPERLEAVTVQDVQRVARTHLRRSNRTVGHYLAQGGGNR